MFLLRQIKHILESTLELKVSLSQQATQPQTAPWLPNFDKEGL